MPTHYHDDHVAGINLLREVEGTEVWAPENVAPMLEEPRRYDLPVPLVRPDPGRPVAAARAAVRLARVRADGARAARATRSTRPRSRSRSTGSACSHAATSSGRGRPRHPQLLLPQPLPDRRLRARAPSSTARCGPTLMRQRPLAAAGGDGRLPRAAARATAGGWPSCTASCCRSRTSTSAPRGSARGSSRTARPSRRGGDGSTLDVTVRNPFDRDETATCGSSSPTGWAEPAARRRSRCRAHGEATRALRGDAPARTACAGRGSRADLTVGGTPFGQQAEALVDVGERARRT